MYPNKSNMCTYRHAILDKYLTYRYKHEKYQISNYVGTQMQIYNFHMNGNLKHCALNKKT